MFASNFMSGINNNKFYFLFNYNLIIINLNNDYQLYNNTLNIK